MHIHKYILRINSQKKKQKSSKNTQHDLFHWHSAFFAKLQKTNGIYCIEMQAKTCTLECLLNVNIKRLNVMNVIKIEQ